MDTSDIWSEWSQVTIAIWLYKSDMSPYQKQNTYERLLRTRDNVLSSDESHEHAKVKLEGKVTPSKKSDTPVAQSRTRYLPKTQRQKDDQVSKLLAMDKKVSDMPVAHSRTRYLPKTQKQKDDQVSKLLAIDNKVSNMPVARSRTRHPTKTQRNKGDQVSKLLAINNNVSDFTEPMTSSRRSRGPNNIEFKGQNRIKSSNTGPQPSVPLFNPYPGGRDMRNFEVLCSAYFAGLDSRQLEIERRRFLQVIKKVPSPNSFIREMHPRGTTYKMEIYNPNDIKDDQIKVLLKNRFHPLLDAANKEIEQVENKINECELKMKESDKIAGNEDNMNDINDLTTDWFELMKKFKKLFIEIHTFWSIINGTIVDGCKLYLIDFFLKVCVRYKRLDNNEMPQEIKFIAPEELQETVETSLENKLFYSRVLQEERISFRKSVATEFGIIVGVVSSKKHLNNLLQFRDLFIHPEDSIFEWLPKESDDPETKSYVVMIRLGQPKTPSKKLTNEAYHAHLAMDQSTIRMLDIVTRAPNLGPQMKLWYEKYQQKNQKRQNYVQEELEVNFQLMNDAAQMEFKFLFAFQHCHVCRVMDHSFKECPVQGCTICGSKYHSEVKCKLRCKCGIGFHGLDNCPRKKSKS